MMVTDERSKQNKERRKKELRTIAIIVVPTATAKVTATAQIAEKIMQLSSYAMSMSVVSY